MAEVTPYEDQIQFKSGHYPNIPASGQSVDSLDVAYVARNIVFNGLGQPQSWNGIQPIGNNAPAFLQLVGDALGGLATGSAVLYRGRSVWYIGTGSIYYSDLSTPIDTATSTLQFKYGSTVYNAGLAEPSVPTLAIYNDGSGIPVAGNINGSVSARITRFRSTTGTESNSSAVSVTVIPKNGQIQLTFPAANTAEDQDQWGIYLSRQGFGDQGPHFLWDYIDETDLDGSRNYTLDYTDADLFNNLAPRNIITAPAATHLVALGDLMVLVGTESGTAILPSLPGQPEQFDTSMTWFLQPTEPVIRVDTRPADGVVYIWTRNSLQTIVETGDSTAPVITRAIWPSTGILGQSAACITETGAYAFSGRQGMVRTSGYADPDTTFALPVQNLVVDWNPEDVVVGFDPSSNSIIYAYQKTILAYNQANNLWSGILDITDFLVTNNADTRVVSAATKDGELYMSIGDGSSNKLYKYNCGAGTSWEIRTAHRSAGAYGWYKWLRAYRLQGNFTTEIQPAVTINSNNVKRIIDGYRSTGVNGVVYIDQTFPTTCMVNNEPYVQFSVPTGTSTDKIRLIVGPCTTSAAVQAMTIATSGAFYVDILANGSVDCNGLTSLSAGTVAAGYTVRLQRKQTGNKWHLFVYNTSGTQVATTSFNPATDITTGSVGMHITLNALSGGYKSIEDLKISNAPDADTTLTIYKNYDTIGDFNNSYDQLDDKVYPWKKTNIKDSTVYQVGLSGKGAGQKIYQVNLVMFVRPVMK